MWLVAMNDDFIRRAQRAQSETARRHFACLLLSAAPKRKLGETPTDAFRQIFGDDTSTTATELTLRTRFEYDDHSLIPGMFVGFDRLKRLELRGMYHSAFHSIQDETFKGLPALEQLVLSNLDIHEIRRNAFAGLTALTSLDISNNPLGQPFDTTVFVVLRKLEHLDMSGCRLVAVPRWNNQLKTLILSRNLFETLAFGSAFSSLETLTIVGGKVSRITAGSFDVFKNLKKLVLRSLPITKIENNSFTGLVSLDHFELDIDDSTSIVLNPGTFIGNNKLRILRIDGISSQYMSRGLFTGLGNLTAFHITLSKTSSRLERDIFREMPNLEELYIVSRPFELEVVGNTFAGLPKLRVLVFNDTIRGIDNVLVDDRDAFRELPENVAIHCGFRDISRAVAAAVFFSGPRKRFPSIYRNESYVEDALEDEVHKSLSNAPDFDTYVKRLAELHRRIHLFAR